MHFTNDSSTTSALRNLPANGHGCKSRLEVGIGSYVKVEADRGEDIGLVMGRVSIVGFKEVRLPVMKFVSSQQLHIYITGVQCFVCNIL